MTSFTAETTARARVEADRPAIWAVLTDPVKLARMTPFLRQITPDGDHWHWQMSGLDVLGVSISPSFTEKMSFTETERIDFHHDPPSGVRERAGVEGWYDLTDAGSGRVDLRTHLEITVDLPLPQLSGPAVRATMKGIIDQMGNRFSKNLLTELGR